MAFPEGSRWYVDGFKAGFATNPTDNEIDDVYWLYITTADEVKSLETAYTIDAGVYDPNRGEIPDYSIFVRYPEGEKSIQKSGYLSINPHQLKETLDQAAAFKINVTIFKGILKEGVRSTDPITMGSDDKSREARLNARKERIRKVFTSAVPTHMGGKKRSSRTRTIRKTRKRNFRGRRRTNRRHRRNVKK
jgi:hypothetical protein